MATPLSNLPLQDKWLDLLNASGLYSLWTVVSHTPEELSNLVKGFGIATARRARSLYERRQRLAGRKLAQNQRSIRGIMSLKHKTDAEIIETATKLAGYSEAGPVLKEMLSRWQLQRELSATQHQQMISPPQRANLSTSIQ